MAVVINICSFGDLRREQSLIQSILPLFEGIGGDWTVWVGGHQDAQKVLVALEGPDRFQRSRVLYSEDDETKPAFILDVLSEWLKRFPTVDTFMSRARSA